MRGMALTKAYSEDRSSVMLIPWDGRCLDCKRSANMGARFSSVHHICNACRGARSKWRKVSGGQAVEGEKTLPAAGKHVQLKTEGKVGRLSFGTQQPSQHRLAATVGRKNSETGYTGPKVLAAMEGWWMQALCRYHPEPDIFFSDRGTPDEDKAKTVCRECPVREACLRFAMSVEAPLTHASQRYGIWGGLAPDERARLARRRQEPML